MVKHINANDNNVFMAVAWISD